MPARHHYNVQLGLTVNAAVRVNGITVHHGSSPTQDGITGPVDHLLSPGENHLEVEIRAGDPTHGSAHFHASIRRSVVGSIITQLDWPADFPALPPPAPPYPTLQVRPFLMSEDHPRPLFADAPAERVPLEGTDETWAPIRALQAAFERGDAAAVQELLSTRVAEAHRFYDLPLTSPAGAQAAIGARMAAPYDMLPLYGGHVVFIECAGGRAVQLLRLDGRPAIAGQSRADPKLRFLSNPVLVRQGGVYRIVA